MNATTELWLTLARERYPTLTEEQAKVLSMQAAGMWYNGIENELTNLFDQYVMMKNLKDL